MNLRKLNEELDRVLNEFADYRKSGIVVNKIYEDIECTRDAVTYLFKYHDTMEKIKKPLPSRLCQINDLYPLKFTLPFNNQPFHSMLTLLYGNENMGFYHILKQRKSDYLKPGTFKRMNKNEVRQAMEKLDSVIDLKDIYIDFDMDTKLPYEDRVLFLSSDGIFYCFGLQNSPTSLTYLHTMFKPTTKYKNTIQGMNLIVKMENNLI